MGITNMYLGIGLLSLAGLWSIGIIVVSIPKIKNRIIFAKPALQIDIHDSKSKNEATRYHNSYTFKIGFTLKTPHPPINIARVQLCVQDIKLESIEGHFNLDSTIQSYVGTFILPDDDIYPKRQLKNEDKYHLCIFALDKEWVSEKFTLDARSVLIKL